MVSVTSLIYILLLVKSSFAAAAAEANPNLANGTFVVELNHKLQPKTDVPVVNKKSEEVLRAPFVKYCLVDDVQDAYFTLSGLTLNTNPLQFPEDEEEWKVQYVYDVYGLWKGDHLLVFGLRYGNSGSSSKYKYFKRDGDKWFLVKGSAWGFDGYGKLSDEELHPLLTKVASKNPRTVEAVQPSLEEEKKTSTAVVALVVCLSLLGLLVLVGLFFFLKK